MNAGWERIDGMEHSDTHGYWAILDAEGYSAEPLAIVAGSHDDAEKWLSAAQQADLLGNVELIVIRVRNLDGAVWNSIDPEPGPPWPTGEEAEDIHNRARDAEDGR